MTYARTQEIYKKRHHRTVKSCWIADIKRKHGKTRYRAWNRIDTKPKYPCPENIWRKLEKILEELYMI